MRLTLKSLIFIITTLIFGCSNERESMTMENVIVAGKVLNQDKFPDNYTIKIIENNLVSFGNYHTAIINDDGSFKIKFEKSFSGDIYLMYGSLITLFVSPGDSIYVEMDANEVLNKTSISGKKDIQSLKFSGDNEQINNEIKDLLPYFLKKDPKIGSTNEKTMNPDEYLEYLESEKIRQYQILDSLIITEDYSEKFIKWSRFLFDYSFASNLFHYTWFNPQMNKKGLLIDIPESFYTAIEEIPLDNEMAIINSRYFLFLHEYYLTNTHFKSEFFRKYNATFLKSDSFQIVYEKLLTQIKSEYEGFACEVFLSKSLYNLLDLFKRADVFENIYPVYKKDFRKNICTVIDKKYSEIKLQNKSPDKNKSLVINDDKIEIIANDILKNITEKNKGKVIYLDFWATWCGPCLMEFEHSKNLAKAMKGKDIDFVFLCVKSENVKWQELISEYKLPGSHYLLNDSEYDILSQKFQIVGIPHYVLIDKNGKIVERKAPNPGSGEQLISLIDKYIN